MRSAFSRTVGLVVFLLVSAAASRAEAQRIGLEAGLAGVENYSALNPSVGLSLFLPLTDRFRGVASVAQWAGCDGNNEQCDEPRAGFGNRGFNVVGLYRVVGSSATNASVGAGLGWYEMLRIRDGESHSRYDEAVTLSAEARRAVAYNSSVYLRGDLSFPTDDNQPRWSFLRLGVDVGGIF